MRTAPVLWLCIGLLACGSAPSPEVFTAAPPDLTGPQVAAERRDVARFCSLHDGGVYAKPFVWPGLAHGEPGSDPAAWRWLVAWSARCASCAADIARAEAWSSQMAAETATAQLRFVSMDADDAERAAFAERHPALDMSLRIDTEATVGWLRRFDLTADQTAPLQIFVDPAGRTRCVHHGALVDDDYTTIRRVLLDP